MELTRHHLVVYASDVSAFELGGCCICGKATFWSGNAFQSGLNVSTVAPFIAIPTDFVSSVVFAQNGDYEVRGQLDAVSLLYRSPRKQLIRYNLTGVTIAQNMHTSTWYYSCIWCVGERHAHPEVALHPPTSLVRLHHVVQKGQYCYAII